MPANESHQHGFHERGYLPHLKREGADYFVTFRLADSLPQEALARLEFEIAAFPDPDSSAPSEADALRQRERCRRLETLLDKGAGSCHLRVPVFAQLVADTLLHFHGQRYDLHAWVVMPNHVRVLVRPQSPHTPGDIIKSWKQYTSTHANRLLALPPGRFWQPEAFDHWVRDGEDRGRIVRYIHNNPVKAGLCARPEDWPWGSANRGLKRSADFQSASHNPTNAG
jgi:REP element-mobilizing transposase RayT